MTRVRLVPAALREFDEAVDRYLAISPAIAAAFVDEYQVAIDFVCENPTLPANFDRGAKRWNLRRFPFALIYQIVDERVVILAVMHAHREPSYWKGRS